MALDGARSRGYTVIPQMLHLPDTDMAIQRDEPAFPARLREAAEAPAQLFVRGAVSTLAVRPAIALVGARAASKKGLERAAELAAGLAARGALVLSGGALGIDAAAHE